MSRQKVMERRGWDRVHSLQYNLHRPQCQRPRQHKHGIFWLLPLVLHLRQLVGPHVPQAVCVRVPEG